MSINIRYISILRGINVAGKRLKNLYEKLGCKNISTYIQSGNVIFESCEENIEKYQNIIKNAIEKAFGFDVPVLIKRNDEIENIIHNNPFTDKELSKVHVTFLSDIPDIFPLEEIHNTKDISEEFFIRGKEIYLYCPKGYGRSKLTNNFFERKLKVSATTRNWKTLKTLSEMAK